MLVNWKHIVCVGTHGYTTKNNFERTYAAQIRHLKRGVMTVNLLLKLQGALLQNENTHSMLYYLSHHLAHDGSTLFINHNGALGQKI